MPRAVKGGIVSGRKIKTPNYNILTSSKYMFIHVLCDCKSLVYHANCGAGSKLGAYFSSTINPKTDLTSNFRKQWITSRLSNIVTMHTAISLSFCFSNYPQTQSVDFQTTSWPFLLYPHRPCLNELNHCSGTNDSQVKDKNRFDSTPGWSFTSMLISM